MVKLNIPTREWVPQWLGVVTMFLVILPTVMLNGAYTGSMVEVSGTLGILSEDITMGYYAASVGLAVAYPIVPKIRAVVTPKTILLSDIFLQILLSLCCANTSQIEIIIICSFLIGMLKAFLMLEFVVMIRPFFSPKNVRSEFYAYFYPIIFSGGQISMVLTAQLAYHYQWQYMYYFNILLMLIAMMFILMFFRYAKKPIAFPFKDIDYQSIVLVASALLLSVYVFTYGKTLDWFASPKITICSIAIPILFYLFWRRQQTASKPYVSLKPLQHHKAIIGYCFMAVVMFLSATSSLVTSYMNSIIRVDSVHSNAINLCLLPGFVVGAFVCFWWFRWQRWRFRFLISGGLFAYVIYLAILYFGISPESTYQMLYVPMFFRGLGMMTLFIAFGVYVVEDLDPRLMLSNAFYLISFRSLLAPVISASFFTNLIYSLQAKYTVLLSENITLTTPTAADRYQQALHAAIAQGHELSEASQIATRSLSTLVDQQALLMGLKSTIGYVLILALVVAIISSFIPFHKTIKVAVVKTGDDMV
ncbi:MAG: MFS transporter [Mucinivorans sp.]